MPNPGHSQGELRRQRRCAGLLVFLAIQAAHGAVNLFAAFDLYGVDDI